MEHSSVLKSKQFPFWYLSTVVEEYRCEGCPSGQAVSRASPPALTALLPLAAHLGEGNGEDKK
jgi:hypothetical protein